MTQDIIEMARQAGYQHPDAVGQCEDFAYFDLEAFAKLVAAAEREACAKMCEQQEDYGPLCETIWDCAAAIRARGGE
jgi:hypothetical protein